MPTMLSRSVRRDCCSALLIEWGDASAFILYPFERQRSRRWLIRFDDRWGWRRPLQDDYAAWESGINTHERWRSVLAAICQAARVFPD